MKPKEKELVEQIKLAYAQFGKIHTSFDVLIIEFAALTKFLIGEDFKLLLKPKKKEYFKNWFKYYIGVRDEYILLHFGVVLREHVVFCKHSSKGDALRDLKEFYQVRRYSDCALDADKQYKKVSCSERGIMASLASLKNEDNAGQVTTGVGDQSREIEGQVQYLTELYASVAQKFDASPGEQGNHYNIEEYFTVKVDGDKLSLTGTSVRANGKFPKEAFCVIELSKIHPSLTKLRSYENIVNPPSEPLTPLPPPVKKRKSIIASPDDTPGTSAIVDGNRGGIVVTTPTNLMETSIISIDVRRDRTTESVARVPLASSSSKTGSSAAAAPKTTKKNSPVPALLRMVEGQEDALNKSSDDEESAAKLSTTENHDIVDDIEQELQLEEERSDLDNYGEFLTNELGDEVQFLRDEVELLGIVPKAATSDEHDYDEHDYTNIIEKWKYDEKNSSGGGKKKKKKETDLYLIRCQYGEKVINLLEQAISNDDELELVTYDLFISTADLGGDLSSLDWFNFASTIKKIMMANYEFKRSKKECKLLQRRCKQRKVLNDLVKSAKKEDIAIQMKCGANLELFKGIVAKENGLRTSAKYLYSKKVNRKLNSFCRQVDLLWTKLKVDYNANKSQEALENEDRFIYELSDDEEEQDDLEDNKSRMLLETAVLKSNPEGIEVLRKYLALGMAQNELNLPSNIAKAKEKLLEHEEKKKDEKKVVKFNAGSYKGDDLVREYHNKSKKPSGKEKGEKAIVNDGDEKHNNEDGGEDDENDEDSGVEKGDDDESEEDGGEEEDDVEEAKKIVSPMVTRRAGSKNEDGMKKVSRREHNLSEEEEDQLYFDSSDSGGATNTGEPPKKKSKITEDNVQELFSSDDEGDSQQLALKSAATKKTINNSPGRNEPISLVEKDYSNIDLRHRRRLAVLQLSAGYPTAVPNCLCLETILDPFLAHVMQRNHDDLYYVLALVDNALWNKLVKSVRLLLAMETEDFYTEVEDDMYVILQLGGDHYTIFSTLVHEVILPLLCKICQFDESKPLLMNNSDGVCVLVGRYVDEEYGIEYCTLVVGEETHLSSCGWLKYCKDKKKLPARRLQEDKKRLQL